MGRLEMLRILFPPDCGVSNLLSCRAVDRQHTVRGFESNWRALQLQIFSQQFVSNFSQMLSGLVEDQDRYSANPSIVAVLRNIGS